MNKYVKVGYVSRDTSPIIGTTIKCHERTFTEQMKSMVDLVI